MKKKEENLDLAIIQKDVLLEMVATAIAFISTRTKGNHPKTNEMDDLREYFYSTNAQYIDFKENVNKIKPIIDELANKPYILGTKD